MTTKLVKPYINVKQKETISKLNFLTGLPIKDICNDLMEHAVKSNYAIFLTQHFKRGVIINKLQFPAKNDPVPFPEVKGETTRITLKVNNRIHEYANSLYYATDVSVPKILASMINYSINDNKFFNDYVSKYLTEKIGEDRKKLLKSVMDDVNGVTECDENISSLLFYIVETEKEIDEGLGEAVEKFASRWTTV